LISQNSVTGGSAADRVVRALREALARGTLTAATVERALARLHRFRARLERF